MQAYIIQQTGPNDSMDDGIYQKSTQPLNTCGMVNMCTSVQQAESTYLLMLYIAFLLQAILLIFPVQNISLVHGTILLRNTRWVGVAAASRVNSPRCTVGVDRVDRIRGEVNI